MVKQASYHILVYFTISKKIKERNCKKTRIEKGRHFCEMVNLVSDLVDYLNEFQKLLSIYLSDQRKLLIYTHLLAVQKNRFHFGWRTYVYIRTYTINQYYIQAPRLNFSFILWFWKFLVRNKLCYTMAVV